MPISRCNLMSPKNSDMVNELLGTIKCMTKGEKLTAIKAIFQNIHTLANSIDETRPDIAKALDAILTGNSISTKNLQPRFLYGIAYGSFWVFDSALGTIAKTKFKNGLTTNLIPADPDTLFNAIHRSDIKKAELLNLRVPTRQNPILDFKSKPNEIINFDEID